MLIFIQTQVVWGLQISINSAILVILCNKKTSKYYKQRSLLLQTLSNSQNYALS